MIAKRLVLSAATLASGYALAGALYWALLNVPESNVAALVLSSALVLLILAAAGVTTGGAVALAQDVPGSQAVKRALAALPGFVVGLIIFAALWWLTTVVDAWWNAHAGETDALFLRYAGTTRTRALHLTVSWMIFLTRWALGLSIVTGLVAAGTSGQEAVVRRGLRASVGPGPLAAATIAVVLVSQVLWRVAYWRPEDLPTSVEPAFVAAKLVVLYALASTIAAVVLGVHRRAVGGAKTT